MRLFDKVVIIGTGLIGGSIGLAIKKNKFAKEVVGISRRKESLSMAKKTGAIDKACDNMEVIRDADLVVFATPPEVLLDLAHKAAKFIKDDCVVFDVASTKEKITRELDRLFSNYVGAHPLAGSEKRGIKYSDADLFRGSLCILTPTKNTSPIALGKVRAFWLKLGAKVFYLSGNKHDKILAFVSHLPHISAFSLVNAVPPEYLKFASSGFKDTTRIAGSNSLLWSQIFLGNRRNTLRAIRLFQANLDKIKSAIKNGNKRLLEKLLRKARDKRITL